MPPTDRFVASFAAEPPQEPPPYGRWADTLGEQFRAACAGAATEDGSDPGAPGEISWYPDRTWGGRSYVPATSLSDEGWEYFGYVSFAPGTDEHAPSDFVAVADLTEETAERNPDWRLDLSDEVVGAWRGEDGHRAEMTLVWGVPLVPGGAIVTAELADLAVDQCALVDNRFTLLAPDGYRSDYLEVKLWTPRGELLARESLYVEDDEDNEDNTI
jgi:hypothetical protein